jgi:hypothetical protein
MKFWILFFENLSRKFKIHSNMTRMTGTLHEDAFTLMTVPPSILPIVRNILGKYCRRNQDTFYVQTFSTNSCRLWENVEDYSRGGEVTKDNIIRHTRCAYWITKAANTLSEYVIVNVFPWQKWLHEHASILRGRVKNYPQCSYILCSWLHCWLGMMWYM